MWDVWCLLSDVWCLFVRRLISDVWCLMSDVGRLISDVWCETFDIRRLMFVVWYQTSDLRCLIFVVWCQASDIRRVMLSEMRRLIPDVRLLMFVCEPSDIRRLMFVVWCLMSNVWFFVDVRHYFDVLCQTFDVCYMVSDVRQLMLGIWHQTSDASCQTSDVCCLILFLLELKITTFISQIRNKGNNIPHLLSELLLPVSNIHSHSAWYATHDNYYRIHLIFLPLNSVSQYLCP